jgi:hypothetical protein
MRLADRRRLMSFGLREIWRRLCRRSAGFRLAVTSFSMQVPDRLIVAPTDLRALDPFVAEEILEGRFPLAGTDTRNLRSIAVLRRAAVAGGSRAAAFFRLAPPCPYQQDGSRLCQRPPGGR